MKKAARFSPILLAISGGIGAASANAAVPPSPPSTPVPAPAVTTPQLDEIPPAPPVAVPKAGSLYVAMGSSYAAGPALPPPATGGFARCGQSLVNYPRLLAKEFNLKLIDRSCSGAKTDNILGPWAEIPPQIEAVTAETRLVTVTIGGNDLNYVGNLFSSSCLARVARMQAAMQAKPQAQTTPASAPATATAPVASKLPTCNKVIIPTEEDYARDEAQLVKIATQIRTRAPQAIIVFVQYLTPLSKGQLCAATPIRQEDIEPTRAIGQRLAEITARAALTTGALVVDMRQLSADHTPCDPVPWLIGDPAGYDRKQGLQWHLNAAGMKATADAISNALRVQQPVVLPPAIPASAPVGTPPAGATKTSA